MEKSQKKPLTQKKKLMIMFSSMVLVAIIMVVINMLSSKEPTWKYAQGFDNNRYLICVDKTFKQYKNDKEYFFLIHTYDFNTNEYKDQVKIPIVAGRDYDSEYMGFSSRYVWLKAPDWTAVDMLSEEKKILDFTAIKKRICAKNPKEFKEVVEIAKSEDYLKVTNQSGDAFFLNLETFVTSKVGPEPHYAYHKQYTILEELPKTFDGDEYSTERDYSITIDKTNYLLRTVDENNRLKYSFYSKPATGPDKIAISVTDSTQALIQDGTAIQPVPQTPVEPVKETSLTQKTFLNAIALGVSNNRFVFRYQKLVGSTSPWYLAWFDLKSKSIIKEVNLETKGVKIETQMENLTSWVSIDGKWAFFGIQNKVPVRIKL